METIAGTVDILAQATSQSMVREKKKSSLFSNCTTEQHDLFRMLSSKGFKEVTGLTHLNTFATNITKEKKLQRRIKWIRWEAREWDGCPNNSGISQWYAAGFFNPEYESCPRGFSVFKCVPHDYNGDKLSRSKDDCKENFQEVFGNRRLSDRALQRFAKLDLFVPKDTRKAEDMLCIAVAWVELLTGENSIPSEPYCRGLNFLSRNQCTVQKTQKEHKLFVIEFLHMVERCFQRLCIALLETGSGRQPV